MNRSFNPGFTFVNVGSHHYWNGHVQRLTVQKLRSLPWLLPAGWQPSDAVEGALGYVHLLSRNLQ